MKEFEKMSDEELAVMYVGGNNKAFDELLSRTQDKLFSYIMFMVRDEDRANDVFQETFTKAIIKLQEGKYTTTGKFQFWLTRIAHNVIMDSFRDTKGSHIVEPNADNDLTNIRSFKEISQLTGVSINTSLGRMRYAVMNLRKMSKEHHMILSAE